MIEEQKKAIVYNLRRLLREHKMTQSELANKIGIAKSTMSDYMNYRAKPGPGVLEKMAEIFEVSKADIDTTYKDKQADIINGQLELISKYYNTTQQNLDEELGIIRDSDPSDPFDFAEIISEPFRNLNNKKTKIPVIGSISAGTPIEAIENIVDEVMPAYETNEIDELFGLVVNGDSMNKIIPNGNYAILKKQPEVENGEIAAVIVNGYSATLKKVYKFTDLIILEPCSYDPAFKDQQYSKDNCDEIRIIGKLLYSVSPMMNN